MQQDSMDLPRELEQLHARSLDFFLPADSIGEVNVSTYPTPSKSLEPPPSPLTVVEDDNQLQTVKVDSIRALNCVLEHYPTSTCKLRL